MERRTIVPRTWRKMVALGLMEVDGGPFWTSGEERFVLTSRGRARLDRRLDQPAPESTRARGT